MVPSEIIFVQVGNRRFQVKSLKEASELFCKARAAFGKGASETPIVLVVNSHGDTIGSISFNGRIWPPGEWHPGQEPIYDNLE
jgi:hypothetical protein